MLPITSIPNTVSSYLQLYRDLFCREAGFEHIARFVTGLILSPNKTLQGIYDLQVYSSPDDKPTRRSMHAAVFCAPWASGADGLMKRHRQVVSCDHQAATGREVVSLDWTQAHHERGPKIFATTLAEVFHEFGKQLTGLESAQVRKEEAVKGHFQLSCVAQSIVQRARTGKSKSEKYEFAGDEVSIGQRYRAIAREAMKGMLQLSKTLFEQGRSCDEVLEVLLPA